ncbi:hypothetical protein DQ04_00141060 [Trypanosoma grayi]|uniref:hypothetical protein n=1 Tax=Trypanosoma grayi TaxID=71804 RepID=UPI0004F41EBF|nr:hypothetical protein DQ04_00141060 [Trypanosoma grayi]KEG15218.1 hypothetical protein DQ04_00141060 [Trypanosoma grayi]
MHAWSAHSVSALLTDLALNSYADHLASQRALSDNSNGGTAPGAVCLEEALAPLQLIHGKVFTSAVGIALHGAELIIRYVACDKLEEGEREEEEEKQQQQQQRQPWSGDGSESSFTGRCLYFVGEHRILSPYYCPCGAYGYQSIRRQEMWLCKHLLALRLALLLERRGLVNDTIRVRRVTMCQFRDMMQRLD